MDLVLVLYSEISMNLGKKSVIRAVKYNKSVYINSN